jgi:hypothetical protein
MAARRPLSLNTGNPMMKLVDTCAQDILDTEAVLDTAHVGDIRGAFGTIALGDTGPRDTWRRRLSTLMAVIGPA